MVGHQVRLLQTVLDTAPVADSLGILPPLPNRSGIRTKEGAVGAAAWYPLTDPCHTQVALQRPAPFVGAAGRS